MFAGSENIKNQTAREKFVPRCIKCAVLGCTLKLPSQIPTVSAALRFCFFTHLTLQVHLSRDGVGHPLLLLLQLPEVALLRLQGAVQRRQLILQQQVHRSTGRLSFILKSNDPTHLPRQSLPIRLLQERRWILPLFPALALSLQTH